MIRTQSTIPIRVILGELEKVVLRARDIRRDLGRKREVEGANRGLQGLALGHLALAHEDDAAHHVRRVGVLDPHREGHAVLLEGSERQLQLLAALQHRHQIPRKLQVLRLALQHLNVIHRRQNHGLFGKIGIKLVTSTSLLLATSAKCSWCSRVLSSLSSVMQKTRDLASRGLTRFANTTNLKVYFI